MDAKHEKVLNAIDGEIDKDKVDLIFHNGDLGYNLDSNNSYRGDEFMRKIEMVAAKTFYQTSPGNHEQA